MTKNFCQLFSSTFFLFFFDGYTTFKGNTEADITDVRSSLMNMNWLVRRFNSIYVSVSDLFLYRFGYARHGIPNLMTPDGRWHLLFIYNLHIFDFRIRTVLWQNSLECSTNWIYIYTLYMGYNNLLYCISLSSSNVHLTTKKRYIISSRLQFNV